MPCRALNGRPFGLPLSPGRHYPLARQKSNPPSNASSTLPWMKYLLKWIDPLHARDEPVSMTCRLSRDEAPRCKSYRDRQKRALGTRFLTIAFTIRSVRSCWRTRRCWIPTRQPRFPSCLQCSLCVGRTRQRKLTHLMTGSGQCRLASTRDLAATILSSCSSATVRSAMPETGKSSRPTAGSVTRVASRRALAH